MPTIVTCPECHKQHRVRDEVLGKRLKCPHCKSLFVAQADGDNEEEEAPAPKTTAIARQPRRPTVVRDEEEDEDEEREDDEDEEDEDEEDDEGPEVQAAQRPWTREEKVPWRRVNKGIRFVYYGIRVSLSVIGAWVIGTVVMLLLIVTHAQGVDVTGFFALLTAAFVTLCAVLAGGVLVALVLHTIGHVMFLATPERPGTKLRTLGVATASIWFVSLFFVVTTGGGCGLMSFTSSLILAFPLFSAGGFVVLLPWFISFWLYMRAIARELRNESLTRAPFIYMIAFPVYNFLGFSGLVTGLLVIWAVGTVLDNFQEAMLGAAVGIILLVVLWMVFLVVDFALLIWGMSILQRMSAALETRLGMQK